MILGIDGKQMSKSSGNCIWLDDSAQDMYGKLMSIPDELIMSYFNTLTDLPTEEIIQYEKELNQEGANPSKLKRKLAIEITKIYHGEKEAQKADEEFDRMFRQKLNPSDVLEIEVSEEKLSIIDTASATGAVESKGEARRIIEQGGFKIDGKVYKDWKEEIEITKDGRDIQIGKRRFFKIKNK
jgi:tyrosyl-tRNA synthetase